MRFVELRPALVLCVALTSPLPVWAVVLFEVAEEPVDSVNSPQAVTLADLNGDGLDDAVVVDFADSVTVFLNEGDGQLVEDNFYDTSEVPVSVATGLFNGDSFVDIVVANFASGTVSVLYNNGEGVFDDEDPREFVVAGNPIGLAVADLNNDGDSDLAVLTPSLIYLMQSNGDGTFSAFNPATVLTRGSDSFAIAAGNLDAGNANIDLAVTDRSSNHVAVFLGNGDGTFDFNGFANSGSSAPTGFVIADPDNNQSNDLIVALSQGLTTTEMSLLQNVGDGIFGGALLFTGPEEPLAITALDVEPDGKVDLAITSLLGGEIFVLCQPSEICAGEPVEAGIWRSAIGGTVRGCADGRQVALVAGKLNADDKDDFVALKGEDDESIDTLCVALNRSTLGTPTPTRTSTMMSSGTPTSSPTPTPTSTETPTPTSTAAATSTVTPTPTRPRSSDGGCAIDERPEQHGSLLLMLVGVIAWGWRESAYKRTRQG